MLETDIGGAVTGNEAGVVGMGVKLRRLEHSERNRHDARGGHRPRRARNSVGYRATVGDRGERGSASETMNGSAVPSASCLWDGVSPGTDARSVREEVVGGGILFLDKTLSIQQH